MVKNSDNVLGLYCKAQDSGLGFSVRIQDHRLNLVKGNPVIIFYHNIYNQLQFEQTFIFSLTVQLVYCSIPQKITAD